MPWQFCWHCDLQRFGGSSKVTAWITKWPTCPTHFFHMFFLGEGFWKQDFGETSPPKKNAQKKGSEKKKKTTKSMDPKNLSFWILAELCWSGIPTPPFTTMPDAPLAGDYASYNDCGVVNGITADAFIVAGWIFSGKTPLWGGFRQYWAKALEGLIDRNRKLRVDWVDSYSYSPRNIRNSYLSR